MKKKRTKITKLSEENIGYLLFIFKFDDEQNELYFDLMLQNARLFFDYKNIYNRNYN